MAKTNLAERGTIAVMQWIVDNNTPHLCGEIFYHNNQPFLIVSDHNYPGWELILETHPLDTWHDVNGMKRIRVSKEGCEPQWLFCINNKFYFATLY